MNINVESAVELTSEQMSSLEKKLSEIFDSKVSLTYQVNANVIGGLRIVTPDKTIDLSLAAKLTQLKSTLIKQV